MEECQPLQLAGGTWTDDDTVVPADETEAAREIVSRFASYSAIIDEIDSMLTRPSMALPAFDDSDVDATTPPHADALFSAARALQLRCRAHLRLGEGTAAFADIERSLVIGQRLRDEHSNNFRCWLMSTSCYNTAIPVIWEELFANAWNRDELERLHAHIDDVDFAPGLLLCLRNLRSNDIDSATSARIRARHNKRIEIWNKRLPSFFTRNKGYSIFEPLRPQGWRYADLTTRLRNWQEALFTKADGSLNFDTVTVQMVNATSAFKEQQSWQPGKLQIALSEAAQRVGLKYQPSPLVARSLTELGDSTVFIVERNGFRPAVMQQLASTAIALELFKMDTGVYPKALSELVPEYLADLPVDPWDGEQLLHYSIRPAGRPALWSIGENQTDENGFVGKHGTGDDIVWHYEIAPDDPEHPDRVAEREAAYARKEGKRKVRKSNASER